MRSRAGLAVVVVIVVALVAGGAAGYLVGRGEQTADAPSAATPRADGTATDDDFERLQVAAWTQEWAPASEAPTELHASPDGEGEECSEAAPCSLAGARDVVRGLTEGMEQDIVVLVGDGMYRLEEPLVLDGADSGTGGFRVTWQAAPDASPIISGGVPIDGWELADEATGIFSAPVPPDVQTRQLYVDGARAVRARGPMQPAGWTRTEDGFTAPDDAMASWRRPADAEIVSYREWKALRCPIASVSGRSVTMAEPCWRNANTPDPSTMSEVTWVENALELLDEPGEWYLDPELDTVFYKPLEGQDMSSVATVAASEQSLLQLAGTTDAPVHDVAFVGLTFAHATWLQPSGPDGYATVQAGWHLRGEAETVDPLDIHPTPGAVTVVYSTRVRFEGNRFEHLGGVGIDLGPGSQDVGVVGNRFADLSGTAIQIGDAAQGAQNAASADQLDRLDVSNNLIEGIGVEYQDAVGILVTYGSNVTVRHNELRNLPYSGISLGWGWGTDSYARNNVVIGNRIEDVVLSLQDGGAIYTLSPMPRTVIERNYVDHQENRSGALFLDEGTAYVTVADNVVADSPRWLHIWTDTIHDNVVVDNWTDSTEMLDEGTSNVVQDNHVGLSSWPPEAQQVIDEAGLEPAFTDLRTAE